MRKPNRHVFAYAMIAGLFVSPHPAGAEGRGEAYVFASGRTQAAADQSRSTAVSRDGRGRASHRRAGIVDMYGHQCRGFGRLFPLRTSDVRSPRAVTPQVLQPRELRRLAAAMLERRSDDQAGESEMPAGYTFLAQFIDHDITLDTVSMLDMPTSDHELVNARTVALDLDSVYGGGPEQSPFLYRLPYLRVGDRIAGCGAAARFDLLRVDKSRAPGPQGGAARALIGDPRNDENFILAQLHGVFIDLHNRIVDLLLKRRHAGRDQPECRGDHEGCDVQREALALPGDEKRKIFEQARDHVIHYYHRVIIEDFLPRLIGEARLQDILRNGRDFYFPDGFRNRGGGPAPAYIPVEFAVAAFRYGHSQVRERYQLRAGVRRPVLDGPRHRGAAAFEPVRSELLIDWRYFFPIDARPPAGFNFARRIDPAIARFLHDLGRSRVVDPEDVVSLPARNLARGRSLRLPSGQEVAERILPALDDRGLLSPHGRGQPRNEYGTRESWRSHVLRPDRRTRRRLGRSQTPLWYYVLQEAAVYGSPSGFGARPAALARSARPRRLRLASLSGRRDYASDASSRTANRYSSAKAVPRDGGHTLGPVGATLAGEVLTGLLEYHYVKTGKGLKYRPRLLASLRPDSRRPLSLTPLPHLNDGHYGRYLMRNLIIDAGQAEPPGTDDFGSRRCRLGEATPRISYRTDDPPSGRHIPPEELYAESAGQPHRPTLTRRGHKRNARVNWKREVFNSR